MITCCQLSSVEWTEPMWCQSPWDGASTWKGADSCSHSAVSTILWVPWQPSKVWELWSKTVLEDPTLQWGQCGREAMSGVTEWKAGKGSPSVEPSWNALWSRVSFPLLVNLSPGSADVQQHAGLCWPSLKCFCINNCWIFWLHSHAVVLYNVCNDMFSAWSPRKCMYLRDIGLPGSTGTHEAHIPEFLRQHPVAASGAEGPACSLQPEAIML